MIGPPPADGTNVQGACVTDDVPVESLPCRDAMSQLVVPSYQADINRSFDSATKGTFDVPSVNAASFRPWSNPPTPLYCIPPLLLGEFVGAALTTSRRFLSAGC